MALMHIICTCGRDEHVSESEAEKLDWQEDGSLRCKCRRTIPYKGHRPLRSCGVSWVESKEIEQQD
ncbi:hypothetical protein [Vibrio sp. D431a]|uniref:hypothetical protein n=1 Tax=Vibrio sp. D431a TaxID=2837388 RepID=UPI0025560F6D|nr:hypothetical protein [Vibrio sp. D431a]MDK9793750.1 hypothetical protein [Vibrio sp. D431a]